MGKKIKDYYDMEYCYFLGKKINRKYPAFEIDKFENLLKEKLEGLEFSERQTLIAQSLKQCLPENYQDAIKIFYEILGPELEGSYGMFTEGYWLWPTGRYVELYGFQHFEISTNFCKELTKRFTSEFSMRPIIVHSVERQIIGI